MKILLIDDHPLILSALQVLIKQCLGESVHIASAACAREARDALRRDPSHDLVLLDLQLGDEDGFDLLGDLRALYPALPVIVVSASDRTSDVIRAIDMGAMGFVPKQACNDTLRHALRQVIAGGVYVPPMSMGADFQPTIIHASPFRSVRHPSSSTEVPSPPNLRHLGLTVRQTDVLNLLLKGQPNKLIARELGLSVETVKDHVAAVLRTLGVSSRTQAVIAASKVLQKHSGTPAWSSH
jgi:DNA-binding NarL/FixJ family response regulator